MLYFTYNMVKYGKNMLSECRFCLLSIYWFCLYDQIQLAYLSCMFFSCRQQINPCITDRTVAQYIRQFYDVFCCFIKHCGKKMAQVMGIYLGVLYLCISAQFFHLSPNLSSRQAFSVICQKDLTGCNPAFFHILQQFPAQFFR